MPLDTKAASGQDGTSSFVVLHKAFTDARRNMHLAQKTEGTADFLLQERVKARNKVNTAFTKLSQAAKEGELSPSLSKDLKDAKTGLHEQDTLLKEAETKSEAAKQKAAASLASFQKAKANCEEAGCSQFHGARKEIPEPSKEEAVAEKKAKEEQERRSHQEAQARAAEKEPKDGAEKEEELARRKEKWQRMKEAYQKTLATKKRRRDEYERANPPNRSRAGSKPWNEDSDEPNSKKPRPTAQQSRPAVEPAAKPAAEPSRYQPWVLAATEALKDYSTLSSFPSPPASACSKVSCKSETRALAACACDIRRSLSQIPVSKLKHFRLLFHPDKFSKCRKEMVESFKKKASEVFVVAEAMYEAKK